MLQKRLSKSRAKERIFTASMLNKRDTSPFYNKSDENVKSS